MAITVFNLRKWARMLTGRSVLHVHQGLGSCFDTAQLRGYYNDLTEKVRRMPELLHSTALPEKEIESGRFVTFAVDIFQYGLGAYDLYLQTQQDVYLKKFLQCADWALQQQEESGVWNAFSFWYPDAPYGAMCQSEGASVLLRAYCQSKDSRYLLAAQRALDTMLLPTEQGGTARYDGERLFLLEFTIYPPVLNGWIFAIFGLYDAVLCGLSARYQQALDRTCKTLQAVLGEFDNGYWTKYDLGKRIASPFYHQLHIAQLQALHCLRAEQCFADYAQKWEGYAKKRRNRCKAFVVKAIQKIRE